MMTKALIKKELLQFLSIYTFDKRKGTLRSTAVTVLMMCLMGFAFISFSFMFFGMYSSIAPAALEAGESWLLFSIAGALTLAISVFGSAFTTYSVLYKAKDNELLLSMPIPASRILLVRVLTICAFSLIFILAAWTPSLIAYLIFIGFSPAVLIGHIIMTVVLTAFVTAVTSVLGWLIALVSGLFRNKTVVTVLISLLFIGAYYTFYFRMNAILRSVVENISKISEAMHGWARPLMQLGKAASGEPLPLVGSLLIAAALFAVMYAVLAKTLFGLMTASDRTKKAVYREKRAAQSTPARALLKREIKHFFSSAVLILNVGFGVLILIAGCVAAVIKADAIRAFLSGGSLPEFVMGLKALLPALVVSMVTNMDSFTASSVSLEGKQIWLVQSMPVSDKLTLRMKELTHFLISGVPGAIAAAVLSAVVGSNVWAALLSSIFAAVFVWLNAGFGLMMNLVKPNLEWTNESVPVKQGIPVALSMLFGFGSLLILGGIMVGMCLTVGAVPALICSSVLAAVPAVLIDLWIKTRGAERFRFIS